MAETKGYRIVAWDVVSYVIAESAAKAKAGVARQIHEAEVSWWDAWHAIEECRRWKDGDGLPVGTHKTTCLRWGVERVCL